ncbi:zinc finger protein ZAT5 [Zea mays]|jgi:hypothetical protein|uniref:ZFP16-2 n=1 Tax=Zea mays TaxID=4577 RepID=A0A1D6GE74_MAIZE|nr:zinc finger protein ZAT5 [Zea mays]AQK61917.1 ZFP16-2 [Zea mays]|eukprot:XP_008644384.1 zinc finger protein ZAT5 [Zea mays]
MTHPRPDHEPAGEVSLALALSTDSSGGSAGAPAAKRARRRGAAAATSGEGEFVCRTCSRAFTSFQALGGHRTSHLRGRHGLELGVGARALSRQQHKHHQQAGDGGGGDREPLAQHECHVCGLGFEMGQALGGHMRRHREETTTGAADAWVWRADDALQRARGGAADPPVLLELFA